MTTVRIPEGPSFPWRVISIGLLWLLPLLIVAGLLSWLWLECREEVAALKQQIIDLEANHAAVAAGLVVRYQELQAQHAEAIADLKDEHAQAVADLNVEKAALEQRVADLEAELDRCRNDVKGLRQRADRLEAELDGCLQALNQPRPLQVVLPELMRDNTTSIFVIDDSGSMVSEIVKVQETLEKMRDKPTVNAQVSAILFGDSVTTLFNFTDPAAAPWDYAISVIKAEHGGTDIDRALQAAFDSIKDEPDPNKRIVLLSDGHGFVDASTLAAISGASIPIDTVAFGLFADRNLLSRIAQATNGEYKAAN